MSPQRVVAEPEQQALDRLVGVVLAMPRAEREAWLAGLPADDLDLVEQALADVTAVGWRADPATMAAHLDATFKVYRYVQLLSRKWREACDGTSKRQIWNLQGRLGKSTLAQWGTVWRFDNRPDARFIFWSYGKSLAVENAVGVRDRLQQHADVVRCQLRADRRRMDRFVTAEGGGLVAAGPGSVVRGFGAGNGGGIVFDDPFKNWQEAHSANRRELVWNEVRSLYDRLDDEQAFIIHVHHRVHEDDVTARLLAEEERGGDVWDHVVLPALAVGPDDPLGREEGEPVEPARFSVAFLQQQARSMGSYLACTPAETPIVMADWTIRPISEVRAGDQVLGFSSERGHKMRWQVATVLAAATKPGVVADYHMESGRTIRATRDHRWHVRTGRPYQVADVGTPLRYSVPLDTANPDELGWWEYLAGLVDGEGHIGAERSITLVQGTGRGAPVANRMRECLDAVGLRYTETHEPTRDGWQDRVAYRITEVGRACRVLLRSTHLAKRDAALVALYAGAGRTDRYADRVLAIDNDTTEQVYALETTTGNYVAWGYLSSNSALQQQAPAAAEGTELLREWFRLYEVPPAGADQKITSWDLKLKDREAGDFVVGQVWWRTGPDVWLRDQLRGKWDHATTANAIALLAVRHPDVRTHVVEAAGSADEVLPMLRKARPGYVVDDAMRGRLGMTEDEAAAVEALRRRGMGGLVPHPPKMAKPIRARAYIVPTAEAGNLHVPGYAEWTPAYLDEMAAFPTGLNDDQVDATSQALQRLVGKGPAKAKRPRGQMAGPRPGQSALPAQPTVAAVAGRGRLLPSTRPRRPLG